jgi:hypothetical protein
MEKKETKEELLKRIEDIELIIRFITKEKSSILE